MTMLTKRQLRQRNKQIIIDIIGDINFEDAVTHELKQYQKFNQVLIAIDSIILKLKKNSYTITAEKHQLTKERIRQIFRKEVADICRNYLLLKDGR